jgi:hypothetical protein
MKPLDIAIAIATLEHNPDAQKADMLREELRLALQRQEISAHTYSEALALLSQTSGPATSSRPTAV